MEAADLSAVVNLFDLEALARERLPRMVYDYYASGADDEVTLAGNRRAFERVAIAYRVLAGVGERDLSVAVLGRRLSMPVLVAPTAFHKLAHPEGEVATARAAGKAGTVMILSTLSNSTVEEVAAATVGPVWFQLYVYKDRGATAALLDRVAAAGCEAVVMTVDAPVLGRRERDVRNRFHLPDGIEVKNLAAEGYGALRPPAVGSGLAAYVGSLIDPAISWRDLDWLRSVTRLPVLVKGIVRADDAVRALEAGVDGIVVSNHGGRQLDGSPATLDVLPGIADALAGRPRPAGGFELLFDGGVRRGTDVLKALALGAKAVLVGRPVLWGLAAAGEAGVTAALELLRGELDLAMTLAGCPDVAAVSQDLIAAR